jgi:hypothetical protein
VTGPQHIRQIIAASTDQMRRHESAQNFAVFGDLQAVPSLSHATIYVRHIVIIVVDAVVVVGRIVPLRTDIVLRPKFT